jgi:hypothetical protein
MSRSSYPATLANEADTISDRIVRKTSTTGTTVSFTPQEHAARVYVLDTILTVSTLNFKLPPSVGNGDVYTFVNNAVQTFGFIVSCEKATDYLTGTAVMLEQVGGTDDVIFYTTATSDKITFNATTTGGLRGDKVVAIDYRPGYYLVEVVAMASGDTVTPFSAT